MLLGDFFNITKTQILENNLFLLRVSLNPQHPIFEGHFPGNPIVPGVCLTQMAKELIETQLQKPFNLIKADNIKFTAIVNPNLNPELDAKFALKLLENEAVQAELTFFWEETIFYKFKGSFSPQQ